MAEVWPHMMRLRLRGEPANEVLPSAETFFLTKPSKFLVPCAVARQQPSRPFRREGIRGEGPREDNIRKIQRFHSRERTFKKPEVSLSDWTRKETFE